MSWKSLDQVEPPKRKVFMVWDGKYQVIVRLRRGRFIAQVEGVDLKDHWEDPWVVTGVTHWDDLPKPPH
jgi:hypothetical protein